MSQTPEDATGPEQWAPPDPFKADPVATNETLSPPATANTADASIFSALPAPAPDDFYDNDTEDQEPQKLSRRGRPKPERKTKAPKAPKAPNQKRTRGTKEPASNQELVTVVPVSTSFDLLEGSYQKVIKARIGIMALAGVFVLIAIVLTSIGLRAGSSNATNLAQYNALVANADSLLAKVGTATNYTTGGTEYLGSSLRADLAYRAPLIVTASSSGLDTTKLLEDINALTGPGIAITGVTIAPSAAATAASTTTTSTLPGAATTATTVPVATGTPITISVIATNYTALSNFEQQLEKYPFLQSVAATLTGTTPSLNASITASIISLPYPTPPVVAKVLSQIHSAPTTTIVGATTTTGAP